MVLKLVCCVGWRCKESAAPLSGPSKGPSVVDNLEVHG